ncbi:DNA-processing protein DprA [Herbiconiux sp.]|uniref:DNA-processing protein DprA n=1 Tax=Herbiconiux sp. TaxID=1871186 RepID=UPI0025C319C9|nr:DNA-processing protein DprA [Herbiconiux sp.]
MAAGDDAAVSRLFATASWSTIAEPGDGVAGAVIAALGADRALSMLLEGRPAKAWFELLENPRAVEPHDHDPGMSSEGRAGRSDAGMSDGGGNDAGISEAVDSGHGERGGLDGSSPVTRTDLAAALERWRPRLSSRLVVEALRGAKRCGARMLVPGDPGWPRGFADLGDHAPLALWVRGSVSALDRRGGSIAVVGSRDATSYGEHVAMDLGAGLSDRGFTVVSGAAYGIDGMAHRASLASRGITVAYLAGGVDRLYPAAHHDLLLRIAATGAVVSELPCGSAPTKWRFLQRNRLIAAASDATVVVEAGKRSGSLNTAGHAAALGRPIGAVPGPVTSVSSAGCHRLLRDYDAVCVTSAADVVELVLGSAAPLAAGSTGRGTGADPVEGPARDPDATRLLDALSRRTPRSVAELARLSGMSGRTVAATLGLLAVENGVREEVAGWLRT